MLRSVSRLMVALQDLVRPEKIDLLIGRLVPQPIKVVGDLVLWDGSLEKTVGGTPDLFEMVDLAVHRSETHFARSMRTASRVYRFWWTRWDLVKPRWKEEK